MKNSTLIIFLVFASLLAMPAIAQVDTLRPRYGLSAGANSNYHFADFRAIPGVPNCCPIFENGYGFAPYAAALIEYPINDLFLLGLKAGYSNESAILTKEEQTTVMVALKETNGVFEHEINAKLAVIVVEPTLAYRLTSDFYAFAGFQAGFILQKDFEQIERIVKPENTGVFIDTRTRERNYQTGEIPNTQIFTGGVKLGCFYELPMNSKKTFLIVPEISINIGLIDIVKEVSWKPSAISAGISLKYTPFETVYMHKQLFYIDTARIKTNTHSQPQFVYGKPIINNSEKEVKDSVFYIQEVTRTDTLFLPKARSERISERIDTTSAFSKDVDTPTVVTGKYFERSRELPGPDTILVLKEQFRTDSLLKPMRRVNVSESIADTIKKLSPDIDDTMIVKGQEKESLREVGEGETLFVYKTISRTDTLLIPDYSGIKLKAGIAVYGLLPSRDTVPLQNITLRMQYTTEVYPLLPYIFFDANSSIIPKRYKQLTPDAQFYQEDIEPNPMRIHYNCLNIIADRMNKQSVSTITIRGFADPYTEPNNCELALKRANAIKEYLVSRGAAPEKITVVASKTNCYSPKPTRSDNELGYSENRQAVIESDDQQILSPVYGRRYLNPMNIMPDTLLFNPEGSSKRIISRWMLSVTQAGQTILYKQGEGRPVIVKYGFNEKDAKKLKPDLPINIEYKVFDDNGEVSIAVEPLGIVRETDNYEIERLSLTLFPIGQNTLTDEMRRQTLEFLKGLDRQSTIGIKAYCDMLGGEKTNKFLAETRAEEIYRFIRRSAPSARITDVKAYAEKYFPPGISSYNLPEERFLSRTVAIEIRKRRSP